MIVYHKVDAATMRCSICGRTYDEAFNNPTAPCVPKTQLGRCKECTLVRQLVNDTCDECLRNVAAVRTEALNKSFKEAYDKAIKDYFTSPYTWHLKDL